MARKIERVVMHVPRGYRSDEVASFVAQLDDLRANLRNDTRGMSVRELEWQPKPGMNTIGMLLAHLAIVEVWWIEITVRRIAPNDVDMKGVLGIGRDDDGIPLAKRGGHPAILKGRRLAYYDRLIARGREHLRAAARGIRPADLGPPHLRRRRDGIRQIYNLRWVLYHLVEHFAGHYGQILLLRHQYRDRRKSA
jgi:uncharacterized damage-inducible protein DinB